MRIFKHLRSDWFRYGFETIAVVVGILVAFALDNWNEERKQDLLEIEYLNGLTADLANDTIYYNHRIANSEWIVEHHMDFIHQMYLTQNSLEDVRELFKNVDYNSEHLTTQNSTYIELINSGNLSILSNTVLKDLIIDYYRENERAAEHVSEFNEVSSRHLVEIGNVVRNYAKLHNFQVDIYDNSFRITKNEWAFINDPLSEKFQTIEYTVVVYRLKHTAFLNHFMHLKDLSVKLINDLQKELAARL
jgi:hypothetical protein